MRRHLRLCTGLLLAVVLASCGTDNNPLPTGPQEPQQPVPQQQPDIGNDAFLVAQGCNPADITALVKTILPGPLGTFVSAQLALLNTDRTGGRADRARARMFDIVDALVKAERAGLYANDPVKRGKLDEFVNSNSLESRSWRYWCLAFSIVCPVMGFLSSMETIGSPLTARMISGIAPLVVLTCRIRVRRFWA